MGFNMHFYIIFGTNLLTRGPVPVAVFLPILVFRRKGMLMTHKCRGSIIVLSISKSVEPNEERKEMIRSFQ